MTSLSASDEGGADQVLLGDDADCVAIQAAIDEWQAGGPGTSLDQAFEEYGVQPNQKQNGTLIGANLHRF